ncbi:MAG TPA: hypothetical protein VG273_22395 [Bryobacteraceae bacterium]|jgi:hypothetical protein|nr:hypothetical protein [Bryobacteraceae bacterium]
MNLRFSLPGIVAAALALPLAAQNPAKHPDLQGNWTNASLTPLERPQTLAGKTVFSDAEAAAWEKQTKQQNNRDRRDPNPEADVARAYNELFFDQGSHLARFEGVIRTSLVIDPPDGRIPALTAEAQKRQQARRMEAQSHPADGPEDRSLAERCLFWATAGPPMLPGPYNNNYQIVQTPDYVLIMSEMIHEVRIIPLDGRKHVSSDVRLWTGDSTGHWEGDTLVVETTNLTGKTRFRGSGENLHVIERFRRADANTILYRFTVDDPGTFSKPWTAEVAMTKASGPIYEYACHEGNYALTDILAGARADDKK